MDGAGTDAGVVLNGHVTGKYRSAHYDVISDNAIVPDMAVAKDMIIGSKPRDFSGASRAIDADVFANRVVIAQFSPGNPALPFQVLGFEADADVGKEFVFFSDFGVAV
jgi:hypothetical protein